MRGVIRPYLGLPGTFDPNWRSTDSWSCVTGVEDDNAYGGLSGSHPLNGEYFPHAIPNCGVKFFADSLLQRLIPAGAQDCLG